MLYIKKFLEIEDKKGNEGYYIKGRIGDDISLLEMFCSHVTSDNCCHLDIDKLNVKPNSSFIVIVIFDQEERKYEITTKLTHIKS